MRDGLNLRQAALGVLGMAFAMGAGETASAQNLTVKGFDTPACTGEISTFPLEEIPANAFYWLDIFDETKQSIAFREIFLKTLRDHGRDTNMNGRLVFGMESESAFLGLVPRSGTDEALRSTERERDPGQDVGVTELRDSIREGRSSDRQGRTPLGQKLDVKTELRDAENGKVIWFATLNCSPLTSDRKQLSQFVSGVIVESLNRKNGKSTF